MQKQSAYKDTDLNYIVSPDYLPNDIGYQIRNLSKKLNKVSDLDYEKQMVYVRAIQLQSICPLGNIYVTKDFAEDVKNKNITDYDGYGTFLFWNGHEALTPLYCNVDWLKTWQRLYPFVMWINK